MRETLRTTKTVVLLGLFTLASLYSIGQTGPGGVSTNLKLWLKAGVGTGATADGDPVTGWLDNSLTGATISAGPVSPTYVVNGTNYYPSIFYPLGAYHTFDPLGPITILNSTVFIAGTPLTASSPNDYHDPFASDDENDYPLNFHNGTLGYFSASTSTYPILWGYDEPAFARQQISSTGDVHMSKNGDETQDITGATSALGTNNYMYIGGDPSQQSFGDVSEVIVYDNSDDFTSDDLQKIDSYLAMKYGVANQAEFAGNFFLSDGTQVWATDFDNGFFRNVLTIVRDDASGLTQKQSHSVSDSTRIFVGTLAASNSLNAAAISTDKSAIVIANDGSPVKMTTELPVTAPTLSRFERTWEIQNTDFTDNFSLEIKWDSARLFDMTAFQLLVSSDPTLSSAAPVTATFTSTSNSIIISGLNPADFANATKQYFTVGSTTLSTLPVAMTFSAAVTPDSKVSLNWQTTSEINNNYFTVERSVDAQSWEAIAKVNGAGTTTSVKNYSFVDKNPYAGVSYYRIKQTDIDGKYSYSAVKTVKVDKNRNSILVMYPNPVSGTLYIKATATELATLRVFNMTGVDVTTLVKTIETTTSGRVLDLSRLPSGNYNIKTATAVTKLVKN